MLIEKCIDKAKLNFLKRRKVFIKNILYSVFFYRCNNQLVFLNEIHNLKIFN